MTDFAVSQEFAAREAAILYPTPERVPDREERLTALEEYRRANSQLRVDFGEALAEEHLSEIPQTHRQEIGQEAFRYAWSEGHSSGYQSVESVYTDIAEMILTAYRLGRG